MHASRIKSFQKRTDVRAALMSIVLQHAGPGKCEALLQACYSCLCTGKWKSNNAFPLSGYKSKHRQSHIETTQCSENVTFQLLDERSRVRHLLDSTITTYKHLLAAIANLVLEDKFMIDDFENSATHLLMHDPVSKRRSASGPSNTDQLTHV